MVPPQRLDVVLDGAAEWSVVEEASNTAIDFKRRCDKELSLEEVLNFLSFVFLSKGLLNEEKVWLETRIEWSSVLTPAALEDSTILSCFDVKVRLDWIF